jgi:hypothetical protein
VLEGRRQPVDEAWDQQDEAAKGLCRLAMQEPDWPPQLSTFETTRVRGYGGTRPGLRALYSILLPQYGVYYGTHVQYFTAAHRTP